MAQSAKCANMQFLSVNPEDYFSPGERRDSKVLPDLTTTSASTLDLRSYSPLPQLRPSNSSRNIYRMDKNYASLYSGIASSLDKSTESLCFGKVKKRQQQHNLLFKRDSSIYRPRCHTEPFQKKKDVNTLTPATSQSPSLISLSPFTNRSKRESRSSSTLTSLVEQAVKVASVSLGVKTDNENGSSCNVIAIPDTPSKSSMAVLVAGADYDYTNNETNSINCLNIINNNSTETQQQHLQKQQGHYQSYSLSTAFGTKATTTATAIGSSKNYSFDSKSLKQSTVSLAPLVAAEASTSSARSISPSLKSVNSNNSTTAKHEQISSTAAAASTVAAAAPTEKEKKRKEVSSSRVKKFHRHFSQVPKDEKLINYFSCALVSDILLQGHLYITDQHFAFYSNVFGYVTKVVIPTSSVTKISKEKTVKIIPNAVGVATADERHVFGSFISREAAFRLMCSVCPPLAPTELLPKMPSDVLEYSEELSIEDDSSCSISGNESPPKAGRLTNTGRILLRRNIADSNLSIATSNGKEKLFRHSDIPNDTKWFNTSMVQQSSIQRSSAPPATHYSKSNSNAHSQITNNSSNNKNRNDMVKSSLATLLHTPASTDATASNQVAGANITMIIAGTASSTSASSTPSPVSSTTSLPTTVLNTPKTPAKVAATSFKALSENALLRLKFPTELHVVYLGALLSIVLALFSGFLLYRILDIEAKTNLYGRSPMVNWGSFNDDDIFTEALRWQKELQTKSTKEAQIILNTNLEQIAKVRRSLETLSMLIHDKSSTADATTTNAAEGYKCDDRD